GAVTVALEHSVDQGFTAFERFIPGRLAPLVAVADHRAAQAVRVVVEVPEGGALGTDMAPAPHIVVVGTHRLHPALFSGDDHATHALTDRTGAALGLNGGSHVIPREPAKALGSAAISYRALSCLQRENLSLSKPPG